MSEIEEEFQSWDRQIGSLPGPTCPAINSAQKDLVRAEDYLKEIGKKCDVCNDFADSALQEIADVSDSLEKLRKENENLREHAEFWRKKCVQLVQEHCAFIQSDAADFKELQAYREIDENFDIKECVEYAVSYASGEGMWSLQEMKDTKKIMFDLFGILKQHKRGK